MRPSRTRPARSTLIAAVGVASWLLALGAGFALVHAEMATPGEAHAAPATWPSEAILTLETSAPTLLVFAHPKCPCTRATLRQLASLAPDLRPPVTLVLSGPALRADDDQPLATMARELLEAIVVVDASGAEAARFGAHTSGHVVAYSPSGQLLFSGGVTPGRGHEGPTDALTALNRALGDAAPAPDASLVFGCPIFNTDTKHSARTPDCCTTLRANR